MNVGDKVIADGKPTEITATAFDELGVKVYTVKGSMKDYYEEELKLLSFDEGINILEELFEANVSLIFNPDDYGYKTIKNLINKYKAIRQSMLASRNLYHEQIGKAEKEIKRLKDKIDDLEMNNAEYEIANEKSADKMFKELGYCKKQAFPEVDKKCIVKHFILPKH